MLPFRAAAPLAVLLFAALRTATAQTSAVTVPGSQGAFEIDAKSAKVDDHLGRKALFVRGQSPPIFVAGADLSVGTIEFDLAAMPGARWAPRRIRPEHDHGGAAARR